MPRNESQEPVGILHEEEVLENTLIEIEDDSSEMFSQPKQLATKKHSFFKSKKNCRCINQRVRRKELVN